MMENATTKLDADFYRMATEKINTAEKLGTSTPGKLRYLKHYLNKTRNNQERFGRMGLTPWRQMILKESMDSIDKLLKEYISGDDILGSKVPDDSYLFSMDQKLSEGEKTGQLNTREMQYLRDHLQKTRHVYNHFSNKSWDFWRKLLYIERLSAFHSLLQDFMRDDFNPRATYNR